MSIAAAIRTVHSATPEPLKVFTGAIGAMTLSYAGVMDALRLLLLVLTIVYTAVKLANAWRGRADRDET